MKFTIACTLIFPSYVSVLDGELAAGPYGGLWLGMVNGTHWTHTGLPLNFTNWVNDGQANRPRYAVALMPWLRWYNDRYEVSQESYICEKDL